MLLFLMIVNLFWMQNVLGYSNTPIQYTIQTDVGPDRYFRYQTYDGQFRREKRLDDGTVFGTYGWVDATGLLRLTDYVADSKGYRIVRTRKIQMEAPEPYQHPNNIRSSTRYKKPVKKVIRKKLIGTRRKVLPITSSKTLNPAVARIPESVPQRIPFNNVATSHKLHKTAPTLSKSVDSTPSASDKINLQITEAQNEPTPPPPTPKEFSPVVKSPVKVKPLKTIPATQRTNVNKNTLSNVSVPKKKLKFRPLYVRRKSSSSQSRRRSNYKKARQQPSIKPSPVNSPTSSTSRQRLRGNSILRKRAPENIPSNFNSESHSQKSIPKSLLASVQPQPVKKKPLEGRVTIDFDLGNQYRKERILPDGTTVGEHGYVDPMGILRVTNYRSGPNGMQQTSKSHWVGTRQPYT